jgi:2-haloacid dehalogenase
MTRRELLQAAGAAVASLGNIRAQEARSVAASPLASSVKALVFDTFGTVVDWRGSIIAEGAAWNKSKGLSIDWAQFADKWRAAYRPSMERVRKGEIPWTKLDGLHRASLEVLLKELKINTWTEADKVHWTKVWHRLKPWPDSVAGLTRLKKKFLIAPMSNGNVALLAEMAKNAGIPWDAILGAELVRHYKPDKETYLSAAEFMNCKPEEVMMCAAHSGDLGSARMYGLRTGFIHRPNEYGPGRKADDAKPGEFDIVSKDMLDLASQLGV